MTILLLAAAGALGALARYGLGVALVAMLGADLPWATFLVNLLGCLAFGLVYVLAEGRALPGLPVSRGVLLVGFLGAFTTFSSFAYEAVDLFRLGRPLVAATYVLAQNALGLLGVVGGMALGRGLVG